MEKKMILLIGMLGAVQATAIVSGVGPANTMSNQPTYQASTQGYQVNPQGYQASTQGYQVNNVQPFAVQGQQLDNVQPVQVQGQVQQQAQPLAPIQPVQYQPLAPINPEQYQPQVPVQQQVQVPQAQVPVQQIEPATIVPQVPLQHAEYQPNNQYQPQAPVQENPNPNILQPKQPLRNAFENIARSAYNGTKTLMHEVYTDLKPELKEKIMDELMGRPYYQNYYDGSPYYSSASYSGYKKHRHRRNYLYKYNPNTYGYSSRYGYYGYNPYGYNQHNYGYGNLATSSSVHTPATHTSYHPDHLQTTIANHHDLNCSNHVVRPATVTHSSIGFFDSLLASDPATHTHHHTHSPDSNVTCHTHDVPHNNVGIDPAWHHHSQPVTCGLDSANSIPVVAQSPQVELPAVPQMPPPTLSITDQLVNRKGMFPFGDLLSEPLPPPKNGANNLSIL